MQIENRTIMQWKICQRYMFEIAATHLQITPSWLLLKDDRYCKGPFCCKLFQVGSSELQNCLVH